MENKPCDFCKYETQLAQAFEHIKRHDNDISEMQDILNKMDKHNAVTDEKYNQILQAIIEIKSKLEDVTSKPSKRYESIIVSVISALVGGFVTYFLVQMGLK